MPRNLTTSPHTLSALYALVEHTLALQPLLTLGQLEGHLAAFLDLPVATVRTQWPGLGLVVRQVRREQHTRKAG